MSQDRLPHKLPHKLSHDVPQNKWKSKFAKLIQRAAMTLDVTEDHVFGVLCKLIDWMTDPRLGMMNDAGGLGMIKAGAKLVTAIVTTVTTTVAARSQILLATSMSVKSYNLIELIWSNWQRQFLFEVWLECDWNVVDFGTFIDFDAEHYSINRIWDQCHWIACW